MAEKPDHVTNVPRSNENIPIIRQESKEYLTKLRRPVGILFTGLPGAGKSTLVNTMLGKVVAPTGSGPDSIEASKSYYEGEFEGVQLQVYDTNGYTRTRSILSNNDKKEFDLILICIKITNRLGDSEINLLQALGKAFDRETWSRTVVVLTFANFLIEDPKIKLLKTEEAKCQATGNTMQEYKECITKHLEGYMDKETAHSIPFCLVGLSDPFDPTNRSVRKLPTTEDWLVDLWETCAACINPEIKSWFDRLIDFIRETLYKMFTKKNDEVIGVELKEHH